MALKHTSEAVLKDEKGKPFETMESALAFIKKHELDPKVFSPVHEAAENGYVIANMAKLRGATAEAAEAAPKKEDVYVDGPFVQFEIQERGGVNEDPVVFTGHNEHDFYIWRGAPFALPVAVLANVKMAKSQAFNTRNTDGGGVFKDGRPLQKYIVMNEKPLSKKKYDEFMEFYHKLRRRDPTAGKNPLEAEQPAA